MASKSVCSLQLDSYDTYLQSTTISDPHVNYRTASHTLILSSWAAWIQVLFRTLQVTEVKHSWPYLFKPASQTFQQTLMLLTNKDSYIHTKELVQRLAIGWTTEGSGVESRWGQEFSPFHVIHTGYGAHPVSYPMALSQGVKRPWPEADHSPPTSVKVKKTWGYTSTASYVFTT
jgi:hypothetical protein